MTPAEREAVEALVEAYFRARQTGMSSAWGALINAEKRVRALLAAPAAEPASVAELREAIEDDRDATRDYYGSSSCFGPESKRMDAARARLDSILARLDVTGPVAQLGEADEESAAREAVVAAERAYLDARYAYEQAIEDAQSLPSDDPRKRRACEAEVRAWAALKAAIRAKKGAV